MPFRTNKRRKPCNDSFLAALLISVYSNSAASHGHHHHHHHHGPQEHQQRKSASRSLPQKRQQQQQQQQQQTRDDESPFWAQGRQWNNYQEWTKSDEFRSNFPQHSCGMKEPTLQEMKQSNEVTKQWLDVHKCNNPVLSERNPHCPQARQSGTPIIIPLKWHSIAKDDGSAATTVEQIIDTVTALNNAYSHPTGGFGFEFDPDTDITISYNDWWHSLDDMDDVEYKSELRQGDCSTLNIYSTASFEGVFGWGTKAFECDDEHDDCFNRCEENMVDDGVVIRYDLVAGGPVENYDEGDVLVHEVGHWLGLYHTFQGEDCSAPGDFIDDTPAERLPALDCQEERDSCQGDDDFPSGVDPIHNYMNLSNDPCMFEFTDGQFAWMYAQWDAFRSQDSTVAPTFQPTKPPTTSPTEKPTRRPSPRPTRNPTRNPTLRPFTPPTPEPTPQPTTIAPTRKPTFDPTSTQTTDPTQEPTPPATLPPTPHPTLKPTPQRFPPTPAPRPTQTTAVATFKPTKPPTLPPTPEPTPKPTPRLYTLAPTNPPTPLPKPQPTQKPIHVYTLRPTGLKATTPPPTLATAPSTPSSPKESVWFTSVSVSVPETSPVPVTPPPISSATSKPTATPTRDFSSGSLTVAAPQTPNNSTISLTTFITLHQELLGDSDSTVTLLNETRQDTLPNSTINSTMTVANFSSGFDENGAAIFNDTLVSFDQNISSEASSLGGVNEDELFLNDYLGVAVSTLDEESRTPDPETTTDYLADVLDILASQQEKEAESSSLKEETTIKSHIESDPIHRE